MKNFYSIFFQSLLLKTLFCLFLMLFAGLPAAFAKDNRTKYEEAKLFRQQDTLFIEELNQKILQRAKDDLAAIPVEPIARKGESSDVRKRREARAKLEKVINELEIKMIDLENSFKSSPYFMGSTDKDPAIVSYAASIEERIEKCVANQSFKINSPIRDGSASCSFSFVRTVSLTASKLEVQRVKISANMSSSW